METRRQKPDTPMYNEFDQIINREKDTEKTSFFHQIDRSIDTPIDVDIVDDNGESSSVADENLLYSSELKYNFFLFHAKYNLGKVCWLMKCHRSWFKAADLNAAKPKVGKSNFLENLK